MDNILTIIRSFAERLPAFPDGRIDYTHSDEAPVVSVFAMVGDELLLLKRGQKVRTHRGLWSSVGGYLDEVRPVREKVLEELREELGISEAQVSSVFEAPPYWADEPTIGKRWAICPVLVRLEEKPQITLDWEHTEYAWVSPERMSEFVTVPDLPATFSRCLPRG